MKDSNWYASPRYNENVFIGKRLVVSNFKSGFRNTDLPVIIPVISEMTNEKKEYKNFNPGKKENDFSPY